MASFDADTPTLMSLHSEQVIHRRTWLSLSQARMLQTMRENRMLNADLEAAAEIFRLQLMGFINNSKVDNNNASDFI